MCKHMSPNNSFKNRYLLTIRLQITHADTYTHIQTYTRTHTHMHTCIHMYSCYDSRLSPQMSGFDSWCGNTKLVTGPFVLWLEISPVAQETRVQSQVESYQRLKKMVLDTTLLTTQHYKVRIKCKWSNLRKGVAPFLTHRCSSYWKGGPSCLPYYGQ